MIPLEEKVIVELARRFSPVLRFHEEERFFPLLAEAWLTTSTDGIWPEADDGSVGTRTSVADDRRRGAAVCTADPLMTALKVLAGPPVDGDRPIDLGADPGDVYSLASDAIRRVGPDAFLDIGGWLPGPAGEAFRTGDLDYLTALCSELASAVNPRTPWTPPDVVRPTPWQWVPQPPHPTMYCEVSWAGTWPRRAEQHGGREFPADERGLDHVLAFTYHLLYGARVAPEGGARHSEGQWEAITLFFEAEVGGDSKTGMVERGGSIAEEPFAVVISQGQDRAVDGHWTAFRDYGACERLGVKPVIYVARGTHRNYFAPVGGETFDPGSHGPHGPDTTTHDDAGGTWDGVDGFLAAAGVMLGLAVLLALAAAIIIAAVAVLVGLALIAVVALIVLAIIAIIVAIILFIMWLVSACDEDDDEDAGEQVSNPAEPDEAGSTGPQSGGDGSEEPGAPAPGSSGPSSGTSGGGGSGPGGGPGGTGTGTVGLPNTGSPTGRDTSFPDIRIVERLWEDGALREPTAFPTDRILENPVWWGYRGRWGVRVAPAPASGSWESGWVRVDDKERDWGYFCAERLLIARNGGPHES